MRAVSRTSHYDDYFRSHLPKEQRRAVLEVLAEELDPGTTMGEVLDAAADIGWGEAFGELNLAELAEVLVAAPELLAKERPEIVGVVAADEDEDEVEDEDEDEDEVEAEVADADEEEDEEPVSVWRTSKKRSAKKKAKKKATKKVAAAAKKATKKAAAKKATKKATKKVAAKTAAKKAAKKTTAKKAAGKKSAKKATAKTAAGKKSAKKTTKAAPAKVTSKKAAKKATAKKAASKKTASKAGSKKSVKKAVAKVDAAVEEEALSLDQAAKLLVPMVRRLKEATMQELEERTGMGRRKLRFHIGQLVKNGHLTRHGMGRGTCYTVAKS